MSFMSFDKYALHIGWKTKEAKKRQREGHAKSVVTKEAIRCGENPPKKKKFSGAKRNKEEYMEQLPFLTASVVRNDELKREIQANGAPEVYFSNTTTKVIALDVGVRNLCVDVLMHM